MMNKLLLAGFNHATAPLALRERLAFPGEERRRALAAFRERFKEAEAVLISTCNRVELYTARPVHGNPRAEELAEFLAAFHALPTGDVAPHLYHRTDRDAVGHLFAVASSLDSMVLGETQILGQVREAYDAAREAASAGPVLHPLFQRAIAVGKQVRTQTTLGEGRLSVASVAVDYARQIFDHFNDKTVLCIGAGKMATLVLQSFGALKPGRLLVCNRSEGKAEALAQRFGGQVAPFERLGEHLVAADVVISSTGAASPIITRKQFEDLRRQRRYRPIFLIDIALPRDVEPAVGEIENVYLYNIDDLQKVVAETQSSRQGAIAAAKAIVDQQVDEFLAWSRQREIGPTIDKLYQRYHEVAQAEVGRAMNKLPSLSAAEREHVEQLARRIVNKLLHDPVQMLRNGEALHGSAPQYLHALERLFKLAEEPPGADAPLPPPGETANEDAGAQEKSA
jgi:glutamyl-tRNA reductase